MVQGAKLWERGELVLANKMVWWRCTWAARTRGLLQALALLSAARELVSAQKCQNPLILCMRSEICQQLLIDSSKMHRSCF